MSDWTIAGGPTAAVTVVFLMGGCLGSTPPMAPDDDLGFILPLTFRVHALAGPYAGHVEIMGPIEAVDSWGNSHNALRLVMDARPGGGPLPSDARPYYADWSLDEGRIVRYGSGDAWVYGHLPHHAFMVPANAHHFLLVPVLASFDVHRAGEGTYEVPAGGLTWSINVHHEESARVWTMRTQLTSSEPVELEYWFEGGAILPRRVSVLQWSPLWPLLAPSWEFTYFDRSGDHDPQWIAPPNHYPIVEAPRYASEPAHMYETPLGAGFLGPRGDEALGPSGLVQVLDAAAGDARVVRFLEDQPESYVHVAASVEGSAGAGHRTWFIQLGPGCASSEDRPGLLTVTAAAVEAMGVGAALVEGALETRGDCDVIRAPTIAELPQAWLSVDDALHNLYDYRGKRNDWHPRIGFFAKLGCDPENPWAVQVGLVEDGYATWASLVNGQVLSRMPTDSVWQMGECPPYVPFY